MKKKVVVIEDDIVLQKNLKEFLSSEGFLVKTASDGEAGIKLIKSEKPQIVLLDIILPKKDGYEVLKEIKKEKETKNIPVVLLTNLGSLSDVEKAIDMGATTYLVKSDYSLGEIGEKIKDILK